MQIYWVKYLLPYGAPCSPHSNRWCFLIGVMNAFITLVTLLQSYHLWVISKSRRHILSQLKRKHHQKLSQKRTQKSKTKRDNCARSRDNSPTVLESLSRPRKVYLPKRYISSSHSSSGSSDSVVTRNVRRRFRQHSPSGHSSETSDQHQYTVLGRSRRKRREKLARIKARGRSQKFSKRDGWVLSWMDNQWPNRERNTTARHSTARSPQLHPQPRPPVIVVPSIVEPEHDARSRRITSRTSRYEPSLAPPVSIYEDRRRPRSHRTPREVSPVTSVHSVLPDIIVSRPASSESSVSDHIFPTVYAGKE